MAILGEVDMGSNRLEAGLLLRESILVNSLLFTAEAWSALSDKQLARLEVVDTSLILTIHNFYLLPSLLP